MGDRIKRGVDRLHSRMDATATQNITYIRGSTSETMKAVIGRFVFMVEDRHGFRTRVHSRDYIIQRPEFANFGTPEGGDTIRETGGDGTIREYEVMAPGNEDVWEWSGKYQNAFRIHTQYVKDV